MSGLRAQAFGGLPAPGSPKFKYEDALETQ